MPCRRAHACPHTHVHRHPCCRGKLARWHSPCEITCRASLHPPSSPSPYPLRPGEFRKTEEGLRSFEEKHRCSAHPCPLCPTFEVKEHLLHLHRIALDVGNPKTSQPSPASEEHSKVAAEARPGCTGSGHSWEGQRLSVAVGGLAKLRGPTGPEGVKAGIPPRGALRPRWDFILCTAGSTKGVREGRDLAEQPPFPFSGPFFSLSLTVFLFKIADSHVSVLKSVKGHK